MTRQESFKRRIRERMATTGERYGAARRQLIDGTSSSETRTWVSQPEMTDEAIGAATGRGWNEWCDLIEAWSGHEVGHSAIVEHLMEQYELDGWWAQGVTVSYERIVGLRVPYQRADGTFSVSRSKTLRTDPDLLREALLDADARLDLFPGLDSELRSKPTTKVLRVAIGPGVALFEVTPLPDGRTKVVVAHEKLADTDSVEEWRSYWGDWLDALDES